MTRDECLQEAAKNVTGQRQDDYGSPEESFGLISELWTAYVQRVCAEALNGKAYINITPVDVAAMMSLLKIARIGGDRATVDSFVDLAGYAACGVELATVDGGEENA